MRRRALVSLVLVGTGLGGGCAQLLSVEDVGYGDADASTPVSDAPNDAPADAADADATRATDAAPLDADAALPPPLSRGCVGYADATMCLDFEEAGTQAGYPQVWDGSASYLARSDAPYSPVRTYAATTTAVGDGGQARLMFNLDPSPSPHLTFRFAYRFSSPPEAGSAIFDIVQVIFYDAANHFVVDFTARINGTRMALGTYADDAGSVTDVTEADFSGAWQKVTLNIDLVDAGTTQATLTVGDVGAIHRSHVVAADTRGDNPSLYFGLSSVYPPVQPMAVELDDVVYWETTVGP
jgi:hypothetical protein